MEYERLLAYHCALAFVTELDLRPGLAEIAS